MLQRSGCEHAFQTRSEPRHAWLVAVLSMACVNLWGCTKSDGGSDELLREECIDTPGWTNGEGQGCSVYEKDWCRFDIFWGVGAFHNHPEKHCCACGKARCAECNDGCEEEPPSPSPPPTPAPPSRTPPPTPTPPPTTCDICPRGHGDHWHVRSLTLRYHTGPGQTCTDSGCPKYEFDNVQSDQRDNACSATSRFEDGMLISVDSSSFGSYATGARVEKFGSPGDKYVNTDVVKFTATGAQARFNTDMRLTLKDAVTGRETCRLKIHVSCSSPLNPGKRFGPFEILAGQQPGAAACDWVPEPGIKRSCRRERASSLRTSEHNTASEILFLAPRTHVDHDSANSTTTVEP